MKRIALLITMIMVWMSSFAITVIVRDSAGRKYAVEASKYEINPPDMSKLPPNFTGIAPTTTTVYCTDGRVLTVNTQTFLNDNAGGAPAATAPQSTGGSSSGSSARQTRQVTCPKCGGLGKTQSGGIGNYNYYRCSLCGGKGTVTR